MILFADTYYFNGTTSSASSGLPYIQLLTCKSFENGTGSDLPLNVLLFNEDGCPSGPDVTWVNDNFVLNNFLVALPQNGLPNAQFGSSQPLDLSLSHQVWCGKGAE